jgi:short-subunit dehydrogenase
MENNKRTALITGASSGIGYELAKVMAKNGHDLVVVARRKEKLKDLKEDLESQHDIEVHILVKDLSDIKTCKEIYDWTKKNNLQIEYLVNNAGFGYRGTFEEMSQENALSMINVNVTSLTCLTKLFLKDMLKSDSGRIMNVSSVAGFLPGPYMSLYYATKAFVTSLSESIDAEILDTNVTITTLCPGATISEFQKVAGITDVGFTQGNNVPSSMDVAKFGYEEMMKGSGVVVHGGQNKFFVFLAKLLPRKLVTTLITRLQKTRN